jgi:hypothetical protein
MSNYQSVADRILENTNYTNPENVLKRAEIYAYMARTEVLKATTPEPVIKVQQPDKVWVLSERTGGGPWTISQVFTDATAADREYKRVSGLASAHTLAGYWEIDMKEFYVSS